MTQSRKPAGSPGGTGGQYDTGTTGGTGDLPALAQLPDDDLPPVKTIISDPTDDSVPGLEGKTREYLTWDGGQASVDVTTDYHDPDGFTHPVLDKRLAAQAARETARWANTHPLPQGVEEYLPPVLDIRPGGLSAAPGGSPARHGTGSPTAAGNATCTPPTTAGAPSISPTESAPPTWGPPRNASWTRTQRR